MPKIRIREIDKTGVIQQNAISNTVFVPLTCTEVSDKNNLTLLSSIKELNDFCTDNKVPMTEGSRTVGYECVKHLLNLGFKVLVKAVLWTNTQAWSNELAEELSDKGLYDVRFLTNGDFGLTDVQAMISCAAKRGDCIALIDDVRAEIDGIGTTESGESVAYDYKATTVRARFEGYNDGEYAAAFSPSFKTKNSDFTAAVIPAAFGYLFAYANMLKNYEEWYAVAGSQRGIIPELSEPCHVYRTNDIEVLQARAVNKAVELDDPEGTDNVGFAINPICYIRPSGYLLYGNRTFRINDDAKKTIATSFLNVRNLVSALKKKLYDAARKYTFEPNTEILWTNFQAYIRPLLDKMVTGNGILGYTMVKVPTDAKARLCARINIVPVEAVEDFDLEVILTDSLEVNE